MKNLFLFIALLLITIFLKAQNGMFMPKTLVNLYPDTNKCYIVYWNVPESGHTILMDSISAQNFASERNKVYGEETHWLQNTCQAVLSKCFVIYWKIGIGSGYYSPTDSLSAYSSIKNLNKKFGENTHWVKNICR